MFPQNAGTCLHGSVWENGFGHVRSLPDPTSHCYSYDTGPEVRIMLLLFALNRGGGLTWADGHELVLMVCNECHFTLLDSDKLGGGWGRGKSVGCWALEVVRGEALVASGTPNYVVKPPDLQNLGHENNLYPAFSSPHPSIAGRRNQYLGLCEGMTSSKSLSSSGSNCRSIQKNRILYNG